MNITHTTFRNNIIPYTVIGGKKREKGREPSPLSIILLNRSGRFYREQLLGDLLGTAGETDIFYIEVPDFSYDIEPLSRKFPSVRFLLLKENISVGEQINLGFNETGSDLVLVMWSDMKLGSSQLSGRFLEKVHESGVLCTVPVIRNNRKEMIPTIQVPGFLKNRLKIVPWKQEKEGIRSIFPYDFCGIYNKEKFYKIHGFDQTIEGPYWQKADFGFRTFLWGEEIRLNPAFSLSYTIDISTEDSTPDISYKRFYLKNLSVRYSRGRAGIPLYNFFTYLLNSDSSPVQSVIEFMEGRKWVKAYSDLFKSDVKRLINSWEPPE